MANLDRIAEEISNLDFTDVNVDDTDEAIFNLASDLYNLSPTQSNKVVDIVMRKYIKNIK